MTACCCYSEIKSSVYNQTGEGFFEQLAAYNHMSAHLRRVLLAKSRVDSRNPNYLRRRRTMSTGRAKYTEKTASQELINQLAYDTEHHPLEIFRMRYSLDSRSQDRSRKCPVSCNEYLIDCPGTHINPATSRFVESGRSRSISRSRPRASGLSFHSARPGSFKKTYANREDEREDEISSRHDESAHSSPRSGKHKEDNDQIDYNYASSFETASEISRRGSIASKGSGSSQSYAESISTAKNREKREDSPSKMSEEAKYSKFLYDITQEIVQNGLYKDEELKEVFRKHIKRNSLILDKNKMMYELYQLKLSLNMIDHDDEEEEETIERFLRSRKFSASNPIKPPTPPKVLDENKIVDKLMNPEELKATYSKSPHSGRHTVVLVDANPELLVTERDILATLIEMNIDPQQAHDVYKRLQKKSKDLHTLQMKNRLDYVVFRKRTVGQVQETKTDQNANSYVASGQPIESRKKSTRQEAHQHHINYLETLGKDLNIYQDYYEDNGDHYSRIPRCLCVSRNKNLYDDFYYNTERKLNVCRCKPRLQVKLVHCASGDPPSHFSIRPKLSKEKKIIDGDKKSKRTEITGPKCFCSTRVTPKKNLLGLKQTKKKADIRNTEKVKKYVETTVRVKADDRVPGNKGNDGVKSKVKSLKSMNSSSERLKSARKNLEKTTTTKKKKKKEVEEKEDENDESPRDNASSSRSSQLSLIDRKDPEKPEASRKLSPDIEKSSSTEIKSSVMKESPTKSPKVLKEIKPQILDESKEPKEVDEEEEEEGEEEEEEEKEIDEEESIVESYSDVESIAIENLTHSNRDVDSEKSKSKRNSISDRIEYEVGNEKAKKDEKENERDGDEIVEEIDNVNENADS